MMIHSGFRVSARPEVEEVWPRKTEDWGKRRRLRKIVRIGWTRLLGGEFETVETRGPNDGGELKSRAITA